MILLGNVKLILPLLSVQALSLLAIQTLELIAALWLLRFVVMPKVKIFSFFTATNRSKERNWLLASVLGFGFLILVVFFTSVLADQVIGPKVGYVQILFSWCLHISDITPTCMITILATFLKTN